MFTHLLEWLTRKPRAGAVTTGYNTLDGKRARRSRIYADTILRTKPNNQVVVWASEPERKDTPR